MSVPAGEEPDRPPLGELLRKWRDARGLTRAEVERLTGISDDTLKTWENGAKVPAYAIVALHQAYGCTTDQLLGCSPPVGKVIVDLGLFEQLMSLTKEDGERGLREAIGAHSTDPVNWMAVVPGGAEWLDFAQAQSMRQQLIDHLEDIAPRLMARWHVNRLAEPDASEEV